MQALDFNVEPGPAPTSAPGQEKYLRFLGWSEGERAQIPDPPHLKYCLQALEGLGLRDDQGRPLGHDVLLNALRVRHFDPARAARSLFAATARLAPSTALQTEEAKAEAIMDMEWKLTRAWRADLGLD
jgi:hypothetical protein